MVLRVNPVITKTEFIGKRWRENMRFTQREVLGQISVVLAAKAAAIQDWAERQPIRFDLVRVAKARIELILLTYVPIEPLIPLDRII